MPKDDKVEGLGLDVDPEMQRQRLEEAEPIGFDRYGQPTKIKPPVIIKAPKDNKLEEPLPEDFNDYDELFEMSKNE